MSSTSLRQRVHKNENDSGTVYESEKLLDQYEDDSKVKKNRENTRRACNQFNNNAVLGESKKTLNTKPNENQVFF